VAEVTSEMIKELRERTQAGMLDCKKALVESDGDMEKASDLLRKKGLAAANKRSGRESKEGLVLPYVSDDAKKAVLFEMNCETDFVSRNDDFSKLANKILSEINANNSIVSADMLSESVKEDIKSAVATTGENIMAGRIARVEIESSKKGVIAKYIHSNNKIGVLVKLIVESADAEKKPELLELGKDVAMQIAAAAPLYVADSEVPEEDKSREKAIYLEQMKDSGKPANVIEKIIEGKLKKYFSEVCLVDQIFIKDNTKSITDLLNDYSKKIGEKIKIENFVRIQIGK